MRGLVIKNTGSWYTVLTEDGQVVDCKIKGNFRLKGIRSTNPVAVGDRVVIEERTELVEERGERKEERRAGKKAGKGRSSVVNQEPSRQGQPLSSVSYITAIEDRRNYIIRKSQNLSKQSHIIAANVDQAFLVVTIAYPETSTTFIDRFLASAEAYSVPVVLLFNKVDLLDDDGRRLLSLMINLYETIGYECRAISAQTGEGVSELFSLMEGKITLLSGNSGVGKSTLINRLVPGVNLRTAEISDAHNTGMHTTTFSEMIPLCIDYSAPNDGCQPGVQPLSDGHSPASGSPSSWLIDTPGIKGFGTFDMQPEEITSYFKEIFLFSKGCRFSNCTHTHEPGCAVLKAIDDHYIAPSRYQSYLSMLDDKDDDKYRAAY